MIDFVEVGTEVRVTTDKWEGVGFGPLLGETGTVTTSEWTGENEVPVLFDEGVYFVKDGEFELVHEPASFSAGDQVKILGGEEPSIIGETGIVMDLGDDRLFLARRLGGEPPADLNIVDVPAIGWFIGLRNHEIELIEGDQENPQVIPMFPNGSTDPEVSGDATFPVGTRVRVIDATVASVSEGAEGTVIDRDDERVSTFAAAIAPENIVFVLFPGANAFGDDLVQVFFPERLERVSDSAAVAGLDTDPEEAPVGTHIILTTSIFEPYETGDRGVVQNIGAYHDVLMEDDGILHLELDEFVVAEGQPEDDLAEWEKELLAELERDRADINDAAV